MNINALAVSAGQGNKKAISKIKELSRENENKSRKPISGKGKMFVPRFSDDEMKRLGGEK